MQENYSLLIAEGGTVWLHYRTTYCYMDKIHKRNTTQKYSIYYRLNVRYLGTLT